MPGLRHETFYQCVYYVRSPHNTNAHTVQVPTRPLQHQIYTPSHTPTPPNNALALNLYACLIHAEN